MLRINSKFRIGGVRYYQVDTFKKFPLVDVEPLMEYFHQVSVLGKRLGIPNDVQNCCTSLAKAFEKFGACYVHNHTRRGTGWKGGRQIYDNGMKSAKKMFIMPVEEKLAFKAVPKDGLVRGYLGLGAESGSNVFELKEAFSYGKDPQDGQNITCKLEGYNVWPENPPTETLQADYEAAFDSFTKLSVNLTRALSLEFNGDFYEWDNIIKDGEKISLMRVNRYFAESGHDDLQYDRNRPVIGSSPHTDWGMFTVIMQQNEATGLQMLRQTRYNQKCWVNLKPRPRSLIVHSGDFLSLLSKGHFKSPLHRVVPPTHDDKERLSFVYFFYPGFNASITVPENSKLHKDLSLLQDQSANTTNGEELGNNVQSEDMVTVKTITFGEYLAKKWTSVGRETNDDTKKDIEDWKW